MYQVKLSFKKDKKVKYFSVHSKLNSSVQSVSQICFAVWYNLVHCIQLCDTMPCVVKSKLVLILSRFCNRLKE